MHSYYRRGFTLVELSIVLVIIGMLVGGVLSGQALIRAAELRSVSSEYQRYRTASHAFRDKYLAIPGNMNNATSFWGDFNGNSANCTADMSGVTITSGTCNGSGSGKINAPNGPNKSAEMWQFWRQLALAGLIEGSYNGIAGANDVNGWAAVGGTNAPSSKMGNVAWVTYVNLGNNPNYYFLTSDNNFSPVYNNYPPSPVLKTEEAWNLDSKLDDGKPGTGMAISGPISGCTTTNPPSRTDYTGSYNLTNTNSNQCLVMFMNQF